MDNPLWIFPNKKGLQFSIFIHYNIIARLKDPKYQAKKLLKEFIICVKVLLTIKNKHMR